MARHVYWKAYWDEELTDPVEFTPEQLAVIDAASEDFKEATASQLDGVQPNGVILSG